MTPHLAEPLLRELEYHLPQYLVRQRWFGGKARTIRQVQLVEMIPLDADQQLQANTPPIVRSAAAAATSIPVRQLIGGEFALALVAVRYADGAAEGYTLPMSVRLVQGAEPSDMVIFRWSVAEQELAIYEASRLPELWVALAGLLTRRSDTGPTGVRWRIWQTTAFSLAQAGPFTPADVVVFAGEQSQSLAVLRQAVVIKLFRRLEEGLSPDWEITRFLTEEAHFPQVPAALAALAYEPGESWPSPPAESPSSTADSTLMLAMMTSYRPNQGDAWSCTLSELASFCQRVVDWPSGPAIPAWEAVMERCFVAAWPSLPPPWPRLAGNHLQRTRLLGQRTAELHLALARGSQPAFVPEPMDLTWQRAFAHKCLEQLTHSCDLLRRRLADLSQETLTLADAVLAQQSRLETCIVQLSEQTLGGLRIRVHGDYHLGQVLYAEEDVVILDFEGEPARPLSERRQKQPPLRDVAGMIRSFHYAAALATRTHAPSLPPVQAQRLAAWLRAWYLWTSVAFLQGYLQTSDILALLPERFQDSARLLQIFLLEKAAYELAYELNHRPDWVAIPLQGLLELGEHHTILARSA